MISIGISSWRSGMSAAECLELALFSTNRGWIPQSQKIRHRKDPMSVQSYTFPVSIAAYPTLECQCNEQ